MREGERGKGREGEGEQKGQEQCLKEHNVIQDIHTMYTCIIHTALLTVYVAGRHPWNGALFNFTKILWSY